MSNEPAKNLSYLDKAIRACPKDKAELVQEQDPTNSHIRAYNPMIGTLAELHCEERIPQPTGKGKTIGEEAQIQGLTFTYEKEGQWLWESHTCRIEILPDTDKPDAEILLKTLRPIQENILSRGIAGPKITFRIGNEQPLENEPRLADSNATERLVRFPTSSNKSRLIAVGASKAAGISLQGIILHEIGHILSPLLSKEIRMILVSLEENLSEITDQLQEISPHYLKDQAKRTLENFQTLKEIKEKGTQSIKVGGKSWHPENYKTHLIDHFTQELFAETVRALYLEPCLHQKEKTLPKTRWEGFNNLCTILQREVRFTLRKEEINTPLFPQKRKTPTISLFEPIQDYFN